MNDDRKRLRRLTVVYWLMLTYIIAALVWWFITLEQQNRMMADLKTAEHPSLKQEIQIESERNTAKYLSEGITFLVLILIGAAFVYRSVRRQFSMQQQQQNFMMAVTHELKTPISVATLNLETLQKHNLDAEKQKKLIRMTLEETNRLNTLTNNILVSAQVEDKMYRVSMEELNLSALFKDCILNFKNRFPDRIFSESIDTEADINGDALLLQIMINNLIENAIKYSPKEKPIHCSLTKANDFIQLSVTDQGIGIEESEKRKVFEKFYRIGNETTRKAQGTGLGLYLCYKIAEMHNADIAVTNRNGGGSIFTILFPE